VAAISYSAIRASTNASRLPATAAQLQAGKKRGAGADAVKLLFAEAVWEDYLYWQTQNKRMLEHINKLIREIQREPFSGVGKPEALKHTLADFWSQRINLIQIAPVCMSMPTNHHPENLQ
jgi:toxin YoeB